MSIKSVSTILLKPTEKLVIKLSVGLLDGLDKDSFYSLYDSGTNDYLTMNFSSNIIIQYKSDAPWHPSQIIHINDKNIYRFNKILQEFYKTMSNAELFTYYKNGNITCNATEKDKLTAAINGLEVIELEPAVIYDTKNREFPGVIMRINEKVNQVDLSIDEYESIMYKFSQINITELSLQTVIARLLLEDRIMEAKKNLGVESKPKAVPVNIFQKRIEEIDKENVDDQRRDTNTNIITSLNDL